MGRLRRHPALTCWHPEGFLGPQRAPTRAQDPHPLPKRQKVRNGPIGDNVRMIYLPNPE